MTHRLLSIKKKASDKFRTRSILYLLTAPLAAYATKYAIVLGNFYLCYHLFRTISSLRAYQGSRILEKLLKQESQQGTSSQIPFYIPPSSGTIQRVSQDSISQKKEPESQKAVTWTPSQELDDFIRTETAQLGPAPWDPSQDISDDVLYKMEEDLRVPEWSRSHRRGRLEAYVYPQLELTPEPDEKKEST